MLEFVQSLGPHTESTQSSKMGSMDCWLSEMDYHLETAVFEKRDTKLEIATTKQFAPLRILGEIFGLLVVLKYEMSEVHTIHTMMVVRIHDWFWESRSSGLRGVISRRRAEPIFLLYYRITRNYTSKSRNFQSQSAILGLCPRNSEKENSGKRSRLSRAVAIQFASQAALPQRHSLDIHRVISIPKYEFLLESGRSRVTRRTSHAEPPKKSFLLPASPIKTTW